MIQIDPTLTASSLKPQLDKLFELSAQKIRKLQERWKPSSGAPVFTVEGRYTSRGWTEWTQGFQFGSAILQFDATGDKSFLEIGREGTLHYMASHVSHVGVHDHGFNNVSTYGNLRRLMNEGRIPVDPWEKHFCELALKVSGAVQAARWTDLGSDQGFIFSFNGPHSLFADTIRSLRSLSVAHQLGHVLMGEKDSKVSFFIASSGTLSAQPATTFTLVKAVTPMMFPAALPTSPFSTFAMVLIAARAASKATRRSQPGRGDTPGFSVGMPSS